MTRRPWPAHTGRMMIVPAMRPGPLAHPSGEVTRRQLLLAAGSATVAVTVGLTVTAVTAPAVAHAATMRPQTPTAPPRSFDPLRFSGARIRLLAGAHPWTDSITPQLGAFARVTGILVEHEDVADDDELHRRLAAGGGKGDVDVVLSAPRRDGPELGASPYAALDGFARDSSLTASDVDPADLVDGLVRVPLRGESAIVLRHGSPAAPTGDELVDLARRLHDPQAGSSFLYSYDASGLAEDVFDRHRHRRRRGDLPRLYGPTAGSVAPGDVALFQQGALALLVHGSVLDPDAGRGADRVAVADLDPTRYVYGLSIAAGSRQKEASWYFIQWATRPGQNSSVPRKAQYGLPTGARTSRLASA